MRFKDPDYLLSLRNIPSTGSHPGYQIPVRQQDRSMMTQILKEHRSEIARRSSVWREPRLP